MRKDVGVHRQLGGWLRSSHSFKECVIAHQSSVPAPKMVGTQASRRSYGVGRDFGHVRLVGERCVRSEAGSVSLRGVHGSENPGMSSEKRGENPRRRKPKVS